MPPLARKRKRFAAAHIPAIKAVLEGRYECADAHDAEAVLKTLERQFFTMESAPRSLLIWIRDYALTDEERAEGYKGHAARITLARSKGGGHTLKAEKHWLPLTRHPGRKRPSYPHPDANHPLLKSIRSGALYDRVEDAEAILSALHAQFPRTSIPGGAKLHIQIYSKPEKTESGEKTPPVTKHLLEIVTTSEGKFTLRLTAKPQATPRKKPKAPPTPAVSPTDAPTPTGFFSARESLKRVRKKH